MGATATTPVISDIGLTTVTCSGSSSGAVTPFIGYDAVDNYQAYIEYRLLNGTWATGLTGPVVTSGAATVSGTITGLSADTGYGLRTKIRVKSSIGGAEPDVRTDYYYSAEETFITDAPYVDTSTVTAWVTSITTNSATINMSATNIVPHSENKTLQSFRFVSYINDLNSTYHTIDDPNWIRPVTGLTPGTYYTARCRVIRLYTDSSTWYWGSLQDIPDFTTDPYVDPAGITTSYSSVTDTSVNHEFTTSNVVEHEYGGGLTEWRVYRYYRPNDSGNWIQLANATGNPTSGTLGITGLTPSTLYGLRSLLARKDDAGVWYNGPSHNTTFTTNPYVDPTSISVSSNTVNNTSANLTFSVSNISEMVYGEGLDSYVVDTYYKVNGSGTWLFKQSNPNVTSGSNTLTGLSPNTTYDIKAVLGRKAPGDANYTYGPEDISIAEFTTPQVPQELTATVSLNSSSTWFNSMSDLGLTINVDVSSLAVNWGEINNWGFQIQTRKDPSTTWVFLDSQSFTGSQGTNYAVEHITPEEGETWDYRVYVFANDGTLVRSGYDYLYNQSPSSPNPPTGNWQAAPTLSSATISQTTARVQGSLATGITTYGSGDASSIIIQGAWVERRFGTGGSWSTVGSVSTNVNIYDNLNGLSSGTYYYRIRNDFLLVQGNINYVNPTTGNDWISYSSLGSVYHQEGYTIAGSATATKDVQTAENLDLADLSATVTSTTSQGTLTSVSGEWRKYRASDNALLNILGAGQTTASTSLPFTSTITGNQLEAGIAVYFKYSATTNYLYIGLNRSATETFTTGTITGKTPITYTGIWVWNSFIGTGSDLEVSGSFTNITGTYDSITNIDTTMYWRPIGGAWSAIGTASGTTIPQEVIGTKLGLSDTITYEYKMSTRMRGMYLGVPFDQTDESAVIQRVFNIGNSGDYIHLFDPIALVYSFTPAGVQITSKITGITGTPATTYESNVYKVQRRIFNDGVNWVDLTTLNPVSITPNYTNVFVDTAGNDGTVYDYRVTVTSTAIQETGDNTYVETVFVTSSDHETIEYDYVSQDMYKSDYSALVTNYFSITHSGTAPTRVGSSLTDKEWAYPGTYLWTSWTNTNELPRGLIQLREVWSEGVSSQASNAFTIVLADAPAALTSVSAFGTYGGNRMTWNSDESSTKVMIERGGSEIITDLLVSDSAYIDSAAAASIAYTYNLYQYFEDAGYKLYSLPVSIGATRPAMPAVPALPEIDSAAFIGKSGVARIFHLAPQGTSEIDMKNSTPLATSYFHNYSNFMVITDIKTSTGSLDAATQTLLASRAFLCTIIDNDGVAHASEMIFTKSVSIYEGTESSRNYFSSGFAFGATTSYYSGGSSLVLPSWASSVKFYFLNLDQEGNYIDVGDGTKEIIISPTIFKVNGIEMSKLLIGIGDQSNNTVLNALNYFDDVVPFNGGSVYQHTYSGPTSSCLQVLGSSNTTGWNIRPNKGRIDRVDGAGNYMPWWNAGYGKSIVSYKDLITASFPILTHTFVFDTPVEGPGGFSTTKSENITALNAGAEVLIPLTGFFTHEVGDLYGVILTPTGSSGSGVDEFYGQSKGTMVWSTFSSSVKVASYRFTNNFTYFIAPGEPEFEKAIISYDINATLVGNNLRLSMDIIGVLKGSNIDTSYNLSAAPMNVRIIRMRG